MAITPYIILKDGVTLAWPRLGPLVGLACSRSGGKFQAVDVARAAIDGRFQLWVGMDDEEDIKVLLITHINVFPRLKICEVLACVGDDMPDWKDLLCVVEDWARENGCARMQPVARPGWEKVLKSDGYVKTHVILEKVL
jgi:hypothetical protein